MNRCQERLGVTSLKRGIYDFAASLEGMPSLQERLPLFA